jgi:phosphomannomutase
MLALLEFELGIGRIALMPTAPAAIELLAQSYGGGAYRLGRDKEAEQLIDKQRFVFDGIFAASRLMAGLSVREETLSNLLRRIPRFFISQRYVQIEASQGAVMRALTGKVSEFPSESGEGINIASCKGSIHISPRSARELRISAEAENVEAARELCAEFETLIKNIGGKN